MTVLNTVVELLTEPRLLMATLTTLAVFGFTACLVQSLWTMISLAAKRRVGMVAAMKGALPWLLGAIACGLVARVMWMDHIAVFQPGPTLSYVLTVRSLALKLILVGFLKSVVLVAIAVALVPILWVARRSISHPVINSLEAFWRRHVPKTAPYLLYYALLMVTVSIITDHEVLIRLPDVELDELARNVQEDVVEQLVEMRGVLLRLFDFPG